MKVKLECFSRCDMTLTLKCVLIQCKALKITPLDKLTGQLKIIQDIIKEGVRL